MGDDLHMVRVDFIVIRTDLAIRPAMMFPLLRILDPGWAKHIQRTFPVSIGFGSPSPTGQKDRHNGRMEVRQEHLVDSPKRNPKLRHADDRAAPAIQHTL